MTTRPKDRHLSLRVVLLRTTLTRRELYDAMKDGTFPMPLSASPRKWREVDIDAWIRSRPRVRLNAITMH